MFEINKSFEDGRIAADRSGRGRPLCVPPSFIRPFLADGLEALRRTEVSHNAIAHRERTPSKTARCTHNVAGAYIRSLLATFVRLMGEISRSGCVLLLAMI